MASKSSVATLARHGNIRIYPRVDCDVDYDVPAQDWLDGVLVQLGETNVAFDAPRKGVL